MPALHSYAPIRNTPQTGDYHTSRADNSQIITFTCENIQGCYSEHMTETFKMFARSKNSVKRLKRFLWERGRVRHRLRIIVVCTRGDLHRHACGHCFKINRSGVPRSADKE